MHDGEDGTRRPRSYASRYGSTREVAERVGATLRALGLAVDVQPAGSVSDLSDHSAILGTAYYYGKMLKAGSPS